MKSTLFMLPNVCGEYQLYHRVIPRHFATGAMADKARARWILKGFGFVFQIVKRCEELADSVDSNFSRLFGFWPKEEAEKKGGYTLGPKRSWTTFHVLCVSFLFPCRMRSTVSCYAVFFLERGTGNATLMMLIFCPTTDHRNWMREVQLLLRTEISVRFIQSIHQFIRSVCSGRGR